MRSRFAMLLAIAAVCVTTAWAGWTSESLVTGGPGQYRALFANNAHRVVFGTDRVGHLVWYGGPMGQTFGGVWYNRYNPGSGSQPGYWEADFAIAPYSPKKNVRHTGPCIALDGDGRTIHVVWSSVSVWPGPVVPDTIRYRMCTQDRRGKDKWGAVVPLCATRGNNNSGFPAVACVPSEPNHVLVCWHEGVDGGAGSYCMVIRLREYVNGAWTQVVRLDSNYMPSAVGEPAIAAAPNGDVFVAYDAYEQGLSPHCRLILVKTRHNGVWGPAVNVTKSFSSLHCGLYAIEVNPTTCNPHLVFQGWTEVPNGAGLDTVGAIYHTYRNASGDWLTTPEAISEPHRLWVPFNGIFPDLGVQTMALGNNGTAHVVWHDSIPPTSTGIVYRYCLSEGGNWSTPEWLTSYHPYIGQFITVEEPAHALHMVWGRDYADDHSEIWWKSNYPGGGGSQAEPVAISQAGVELFPNPAKAGRVTVHYALHQAGPMTVTLLDVSGRAVRTQEVAASGANGSVTIDLRGLSTGVYVARLVAGDLSVSKSLVVER